MQPVVHMCSVWVQLVALSPEGGTMKSDNFMLAFIVAAVIILLMIAAFS